MGSTKQQLSELLGEYKSLGVTRLVTLRGDIPGTGDSTRELAYADDLVRFIRETTGNQFILEVAAYPEYHPESTTPQSDFEYFKNKVAAGANGAITQYFIILMLTIVSSTTAKRKTLAYLLLPALCPLPISKV